MNDSTVGILDLSDEILLTILKNLNNFDVLYSLVGVNKKLDNVASDINFTRNVDLIMLPSNKANDWKTSVILDRVFMRILPQIHENVECLTIQGCFLQRLLLAGNYRNLRKLILINLELKMASHVFNENSSFIHTFKHQISDLVATINVPISDKPMKNLIIDIYSKIFALLTNLDYLDLDVDDIYPFRQSLLRDLPSTTCFSSNIVHLRIKMHNFDDCLCLLDGRLSQLQTFIITLDYIYDMMNFMRRRPLNIRDDSLKIINNLIMNDLNINVQHVEFTEDSINNDIVKNDKHFYSMKEQNYSFTVCIMNIRNQDDLTQLKVNIRTCGTLIYGIIIQYPIVSEIPNNEKQLGNYCKKLIAINYLGVDDGQFQKNHNFEIPTIRQAFDSKMKIAFTTNQLQLLIFHLFFMDRRALTTEAIRSVVYQADLAALDPRDLFYNDDE
ncbi:unnamed protein product [Rotaria sordida]|uniref:F-box domain-containing protein n=2 Tax=Rotaria sordida TaxID=392033 RepID=A0A815HAI5_9BILA|nr:unnamed protein product [Rotaria sordida]